MPFCITEVKVYNDKNELIGSIENNHQNRRTITLKEPAVTHNLKIELANSNENTPVSLFEIRCY